MSSPAPRTPSNVADLINLARWLLIALWIVVAWLTVSYLAGILAPILVALGIAYLLDPILGRMTRGGGNRALGAAILIAGFIVLIVAGISVLAPRVADQVAQFVHDVPKMVENVSAWTRTHFGIELPRDWRTFLESDRVQHSLSDAQGPLRQLAATAAGSVFHVLGVAAEFLLVPVFSFYFLSDWPNLLRRIDHMVPPRRRAEMREIMTEIDRVVAGWLRGQAISTSILALLYAGGFTLAGMPLSLPVGLLVGGLTVIPFVGTFVGASIALLVTLGSGGDVTTLLEVGGVILCLHLLEAGVLTPKLVGHRVGLSESAALLAVVAGGKLLGFVGVVLAVPIAATCAVLLRHAMRYYEHTAFFGHESDADVVITPAMATIMPGISLGAKIVADDDAEPELDPQLEASDRGLDTNAVDDWAIQPELGAAGRPLVPLGPFVQEDEVVSRSEIAPGHLVPEQVAEAAKTPDDTDTESTDKATPAPDKDPT